MDFRNPTIMGRDPSFDPNGQVFDAGDPSGAPFFRQLPGELAAGRRLARPSIWEKIGTHTGRRYRDSFMPDSGVLSTPVMQRTYSIKVCELQEFLVTELAPRAADPILRLAFGPPVGVSVL